VRRFSVRTLMAFVLVCAIGLAALRNANEIWASVMLLIAFGASATALVNALILRGKKRYGWTGFAIFSGGYLGITLGPLLNAPYHSHLGTTSLLIYVQSQVAFASPSQPAALPNPIPRRAGLVQLIAAIEAAPGGATDPRLARLKQRLIDFDAEADRQRVLLAAAEKWRSILPGAANSEQFFCVGHSLFSLLAGLAGSIVATWLFARRERLEAGDRVKVDRMATRRG
jgi:hypothetical protein